MKKRTLAIMCAVSILLAIGGLAGWWMLTGREPRSPEPKPARSGVTATTIFRIRPSSIPNPGSVETGSPPDKSRSAWLERETKALAEETVFARAVKEWRLDTKWKTSAGAAVSQLRNAVEARRAEGSDVVTLTSHDPDASKAVEMVGAVLWGYMERRGDLCGNAQVVKVEKARHEMLALKEKYGADHPEYLAAKSTCESAQLTLKLLRESGGPGPRMNGAMAESVEVLQQAKANAAN
ncbi:MAG TPA: hypothetical protein VG796_11490 [Verrucomicrobiales bacterium]|nr:hypothetical protein [Verrucomicrobiales bacterium]